MFLGALEQLRQMRLQAIASRIFTIAAIVTVFQLQEVVMHIAKVVKHIAQAFVLWMFAYLIFVRFHTSIIPQLTLENKGKPNGDGHSSPI